MKKFLLLMSFIAVVMVGRAQQYDERDLLGTWEVTEREGTTLFLEYIKEWALDGNEFKYLQLGIDNQKIDPSWDSSYLGLSSIGGMMTSVNPMLPMPGDDLNGALVISDFLISNNNKLHFALGQSYYDNSFRFVIDSFTGDELKLSSFEDQLHLTLKRISGNTKSADIPAADSAPNEIYTLSGVRVNEPGTGIHIVKSDKETKKIIR